MSAPPVPNLDLARQHAALREEILAAFAEIVDATAFVGGARVAAFEAAFAAACGTRHCVAVANGTDAIKLALRAAGVGAGDEVVVPAFTFVATVGAVVDLGARPVLADVSRATALLDADDVVRRLTPRTKAVVAVDLYGLPCDPAPLRAALESCGRSDVVIVEDAAQAHGASLRGVKAGALGDVATFSFYPTKNLGALGDGGAVTTSRDAWADAVRMVADHGRPTDPARRGEHHVPGVNSRLDGLQAAALLVKLPHLAEWNARRGVVACKYHGALGSRDDARPQHVPQHAQHAYHVFALRSPHRDALAAALGRRGVQARVVYPEPVHGNKAYSGLGWTMGDFPEAESWAREVLTLPMFPELTDEEVDRVARALPEALDEARRA